MEGRFGGKGEDMNETRAGEIRWVILPHVVLASEGMQRSIGRQVRYQDRKMVRKARRIAEIAAGEEFLKEYNA
jgi:hypothetical protein